MIISEIDNRHVYDLAHACLAVLEEKIINAKKILNKNLIP
jgi:hypothetical protein